jgi:phosphopentomutase
VPAQSFSRVIVIVLDGVGVGELPDAEVYGDVGSDTFGNLSRLRPMHLPTLDSLGLSHVAGRADGEAPWPTGAFGRMAEVSPGKDSVTGHWEMMGVVLDCPFPVFPQGFPPNLIAQVERGIGRKVLGNVVASGTAIIEALGGEHVRTGRPIVYTSADSVFQVAAHEEVIPVEQLYRICEIAFDLVSREYGVGRVIARPFVGEPGHFVRTAYRHDYTVEPTGRTLLDALADAGHEVAAVGKVSDLFAGRGITRTFPTASDAEGMDRIESLTQTMDSGFVLANLVDFDALYGHRNDAEGYAQNLESFDRRLARFLPQLRPKDLLVVTADHGNDPTTPSTDHSREHVPLLLAGRRVRRAVNLGTRDSFADLGQTIASSLCVGPLAHGCCFLEDIVEYDS